MKASVFAASLMLANLLTPSAVFAHDSQPIEQTIAEIEAQFEREETILVKGRFTAPWDLQKSADGPRQISDQLPTTFGPLMEVASPDGEQFLTLDGDNLAVRDAGSDALRALTRYATPKLTFRATEESSPKFPAAWSPNGQYVAAMRLDLRLAPVEQLLDTRTTPPTRIEIPYSRAGEALPLFDGFIFDLRAGTRVPMQLGDVTDLYVNISGWSADSSFVYVQTIDRASKNLRLLAVDRKTGEARELMSETAQTYVDTPMTTAPQLLWPMTRSNTALYLSERTGWRHIYSLADDGTLRAVTRGEFLVRRIVMADEATGWIYAIVSRDSDRPYDEELVRLPRGGGPLQSLDSGAGSVTISVSPQRDRLHVVRSDIDRAPTAKLIDLATLESTLVGQFDPAPLQEIGISSMEAFETRSIDGKWMMRGVILKPHDFDPAKRYPVMEIAYGGMQWDFIPREFYGSGVLQTGYNGLLARAFAARGYIVVMVSAPGTPSRGRAFQDATYGIWPQTVVPNHAKWIRDAAAERPWMDIARTGVYGNSWGGYIAQRAMIEEADLYSAAVAMSPPSDFVDHPAYIEPFMGRPADNPAGYAAASNLDRVDEIKGPVLVMPMPFDVNAGYSSGMKFVAAMMAARKEVELFSIPGVNHRVNCCGKDIEYYSYAVVLRFMDRHLRPDPDRFHPGGAAAP